MENQQLMMEFKNFASGSNCPPGVYLIPSEQLWKGVLFIHSGPYKESVLHFTLNLSKYPNVTPVVTFQTPVAHPQVKNGVFNTTRRFPVWKKRHDYICHLLQYLVQSFSVEELNASRQFREHQLESIKRAQDTAKNSSGTLS